MPELPEVETVRKGLAPWVEGKRIDRVTLLRPDLRAPIPADLPQNLRGASVARTERHGKTMIWRIDNGPDLAWHLGMSGSFRAGKDKTPLGKHDHVEILFENGTQILFNDPRRFGNLFYAPETWQGIDPLTEAFTPEVLHAMMARRKTPVKALLLDQRLIAGIGNIYASEACFMAKLHPATPAGAVSTSKNKVLFQSIQTVLKSAIASGGSSLRNHINVDGRTGKFQHHFTVYGRAGKPCPVCRTAIGKLQMAGRSTFFCPVCQA